MTHAIEREREEQGAVVDRPLLDDGEVTAVVLPTTTRT
jgi:hypothetical protein